MAGRGPERESGGGQTAELGADLAGAGVVAAVEYGQGLPPGVARRLRVTDVALAVAQVREHDRIVPCAAPSPSKGGYFV